MTDLAGKLIKKPGKWGNERIITTLKTLLQGKQTATDFGLALARTVNASTPTIPYKGKETVSSKVLNTSRRRNSMSPKLLARRWGTHHETAKRTMEATTQHGVRSVMNPTMTHRYQKNNRLLRYRRLSHDMFTDRLEASVCSWFRQNRYAQVFATAFGWCCVYPMRKRRDAHHGLSLMAAQDDIPPHLIMDGSEEQTIGEFRKKARMFGSHIKQSKPYSPWQIMAEGAIIELKRGSGRKMMISLSPAKLWDHCIELKALIRLHTALDIYELK